FSRFPRRRAGEPARAGAVDCVEGESADGAGGGEPVLGAVFFDGSGGDGGGLWIAGGAAESPGVTGLAGGGVHGGGVVAEVVVQADGDVVDVSAGVCCDGADVGGGPEEPVVDAGAAVSPFGGGGAGQRPGGGGAVERQDVWAFGD